MKKEPSKSPKVRNPFYKPLAVLGHKVLKNKGIYSKRGKNHKNIPGLHTDIPTPPVAHARPREG